MKPCKVVPILKERLWGGQKLRGYNKSFEGSNIGESWETDKDTMPVLIKLIDANDILSVQVHPDDALAFELEGQQKGKTEAWIVLDCEENAELVAGLKQGTTQAQLEKAMVEGCIQQFLNIIKVKKGDCIYIPAGTVHCLGKGMLIYEVQQPSDITYRLYDWDRTDAAGKLRELHILKALKSINFECDIINVDNLYQTPIQPQQEKLVFQNEYFKTSYLLIEKGKELQLQCQYFSALTLISGIAKITYEGDRKVAIKGDTWIVPEGCNISVEATDKVEMIVSS